MDLDDAARMIRNGILCTCGHLGSAHCEGCDACPGMNHAENCPHRAEDVADA